MERLWRAIQFCKKFLIFTVGMPLGQLASCIEGYQMEAWRTLVAQLYFFVFTAFGGIQRFRQMRKQGEEGAAGRERNPQDGGE